MAKLTINDLVESKELDSKAMSAVRGGNSIDTHQNASAYFGDVSSHPAICGGSGDGNTVLVAPVVSFQEFYATQAAYSDLVDTYTKFDIHG